MVEEAETTRFVCYAGGPQYEVKPNLIFYWRKLIRKRTLTAIPVDEEVVAASEVKQLWAGLREAWA